MKRAMREYKDMKPRSEGGKRARLEDDVKREKDEGNAAMEIEDETLLRSTGKSIGSPFCQRNCDIVGLCGYISPDGFCR